MRYPGKKFSFELDLIVNRLRRKKLQSGVFLRKLISYKN